MKLYTIITDSEFSMDFVNLFGRFLVHRFLVFSGKGVLLHITSHHFGHLRLPYKSSLLITSPNLSSFYRRVPYIHCGLLSSPYFCIQKCNGFHYLSLHSTRGRFFPFALSGQNNFCDCLQKFWVVQSQFWVVLLKLYRALVCLDYI